MKPPPTIAKSPPGHKVYPQCLFLGLALVWFALMQMLPHFQPSSKILGTAIELNTSEIIALTNLERQKAGLKPLQPDQKLMLAAEAKAGDMVTFGYWDHFSPTKRPPWSFILDAGYDYHFAGENLAKDFHSSEKLVQAWMNSTAHRENILSDKYENIGVAVLQAKLDDKDTLLVVQMFGTRFNAEDYLAAQDRANAMTATATGLLTPKRTWYSSMTEPFRWTQLTSLLLIGVILFNLSKKLIQEYRQGHKPLSIHYWGHLMLLLTSGLLIIATHQGRIR